MATDEEQKEQMAVAFFSGRFNEFRSSATRHFLYYKLPYLLL